MFLPIAGAALGGLQAYQQSKGDLGAALLGAGLGAAGGVGLRGLGGLATRFAGQALPAGLTGSSLSAVNAARGIPVLGKLIPGNLSLAQQAGLGSKITGAAGLLPAAAGAATVGLGAMAVPALAGGLAAGAPGAIGRAGRAAGNVLGLTGQATGISTPDIPALPGSDATGLTPGQIYDQYGPPGLAETMNPLGFQQAQQALERQMYLQRFSDAARYMAPMQEAYQQRSKEAEMIRGAKAAQLATALATDAAMRQQGQLGAQRMAEGFMSNIGQAGSTQYRYF